MLLPSILLFNFGLPCNLCLFSPLGGPAELLHPFDVALNNVDEIVVGDELVMTKWAHVSVRALRSRCYIVGYCELAF